MTAKPAGPVPPAALALAGDVLLLVASYLAAYLIRFPGAEFYAFLPGALESLPLVVISQLAALGLTGVYAPAPRRSRVVALFLGAVLGTAGAFLLTGLLLGLEGRSRMAFLVDLVLFVIAAVGWRGSWQLWYGVVGGRPVEPIEPDVTDLGRERNTLINTVLAFFRYRELLKNLVLKDLKLKYRGSVIGFLWSLVNPLLMIGVYTFAFTYIIGIRAEGYVFYVLLGILAWTFFANSAVMSTGAIVDNGGLIKSVFFPRAILPVATVVFNLAQYLLTAVVFLPIMLLAYRVPPSGPMLLFPVFLFLQLVFTIGIALILSTGTAFFRDVRHFLEIGLAAMFWTTPIVYQLNQVPQLARVPILLSPLSPFVVAYQQMFYYRQWPDLSVWLIAITYAAGAFLVGATLILTFEDQFSEQI